MLLLWIAAAHAACPSTSADLSATLDAAEGAFADMDTAAFLTATNRATAEANCLRESAPRSTIARLHRVEGLRAYVDKDADRAARAFAAARAIEPGYTFPDAMVPPGHPVRTQYATLDPNAGGTTAAPPPTDGYLAFDGRSTSARPNARPTLAQLVGDDGTVSQSRYLWPEDPLFDYPTAAVAPTPTVSPTSPAPTSLPTTPVAHKKGPNVPLVVAAGASLVLSGVSWAVANGAHTAYYADDTTADELDPLRAKTNTWFVVSATAGVAGLGLAVGGVVAGHW